MLRRPITHILWLASQYTLGVRKVRRPCLTWNDMLSKVVESSGVSSSAWEELLRTKRLLKPLILSLREDLSEPSDSDPDLLRSSDEAFPNAAGDLIDPLNPMNFDDFDDPDDPAPLPS